MRRNAQWKKIFALGCSILLSGCTTFDIGDSVPPPERPVEKSLSISMPQNPVGQVFGSGSVRVGLILPLTREGRPNPLGQSLFNAAQLALSNGGAGDITLMVLDDQSSPEAAEIAAKEEVKAGAHILLGPLFAPEVVAVSKIAKDASVPVIAFSTTPTSASPGVYLLSFLVQSYVDRIVDYAFSQGQRHFAILAPQNDVADAAVDAFKTAVAQRGGDIVASERYTPEDVAAVVDVLSRESSGIDAIFIPDQPESLSPVAKALAASNIKAQKLGIGAWADPRLSLIPSLQGAWYAAPDQRGFASFTRRYRDKYKADPPRIATLSYDAVSLVLALSHAENGRRFASSTLTNPLGFNGVDGLFRFRNDGLNDRGLEVVRVEPGGAETVSPAPKSFGGEH